MSFWYEQSPHEFQLVEKTTIVALTALTQLLLLLLLLFSCKEEEEVDRVFDYAFSRKTRSSRCKEDSYELQCFSFCLYDGFGR